MCLALLSPLCCLLLVLLQLQNPRLAWARPSNEVRTLTRTRPLPEEPSALRQLKHGGQYLPQKPPRRAQEPSGRRRDLRRARRLPRTTATPGAILFSTPQRTSNSSRPLHHHDSGKRRRLPRSLCTCTPPLLRSIKGGGGLPPKPWDISSHLHPLTRSQSTRPLPILALVSIT